jgi:hypothetical protein
MTDQMTITLAGQPYPIAPLTLGQMTKVIPCFHRVGVDSPEGVAAQITIITAAMQAGNPSVTIEEVHAMTGVTTAELSDALGQIAALVGMRPASVA